MAPPVMFSLSFRPFRRTSTFSELPEAEAAGDAAHDDAAAARGCPSPPPGRAPSPAPPAAPRAPLRRMSSSVTHGHEPGSSSAVRAPLLARGHREQVAEVEVLDVLEGAAACRGRSVPSRCSPAAGGRRRRRHAAEPAGRRRGTARGRATATGSGDGAGVGDGSAGTAPARASGAGSAACGSGEASGDGDGSARASGEGAGPAPAKATGSRACSSAGSLLQVLLLDLARAVLRRRRRRSGDGDSMAGAPHGDWPRRRGAQRRRDAGGEEPARPSVASPLAVRGAMIPQALRTFNGRAARSLSSPSNSC